MEKSNNNSKFFIDVLQGRFREREWLIDVNRLELMKNCSNIQILLEHRKYFIHVENNPKFEICNFLKGGATS